jgi:hypothetical protein
VPTNVPEAIKKYRRRTLFVKMAKKRREQLEAHRGLEQDLRVAAGTQVDFIQEKVRAILDASGAFSDLRHQYMAYALALNKSQDELKFMVDLIREHQILRNRFEGRGLDASILDAIDHFFIYRLGDK